MTCLLSARYNCLVDVYSRTSTLNSAGQIKYSWSFNETISAIPISILNTGIRSVATSEEFGSIYTASDFLFMITKQSLQRSDRITNIRKKTTEELIWREEDLAGQPGTVFNVNGSAPILDPFGRVTEFKSFLKRAEVQDIVVP